MIPTLIKKAYQNPGELKQWKNELQLRLRGRYHLIKQDGEVESNYLDGPPGGSAGDQELSSSQELLLGEPADGSQIINARNAITPQSESAPLTLSETAWLSLEFCVLWFFANYAVASCLQYTTVASSTILTSTSGVFTLIVGTIFHVEKFTYLKLVGVLASLAGIILVSTIDLSGETNDDDHRGDFPVKTSREIAIGDALAFLSALLYSIYSVLMKKRVSDERRVSIPLFFGLVGTINVLLLWPGFFLVHFAGIEKFQFPSTSRVSVIVLCNAISSLISDLAWAYAVLLTSPIVVTVGLSISIPLSLVGQILLNRQTASVWYWIGALIVVFSFILVNHEGKKGDDAAHIPDTADLVAASG